MSAWLVLLLAVAVALASDEPELLGELVSAVQTWDLPLINAFLHSDSLGDLIYMVRMRDMSLVNALLDSLEFLDVPYSCAVALVYELEVLDTPTRLRLIGQLGPRLATPNLIHPLEKALVHLEVDGYPILDRLRRRPRPYVLETELLIELLRRTMNYDDTLLSIAVGYNSITIVKYALSLPSAAHEMATAHALGNNLAHYAVLNAYAREDDGTSRRYMIAQWILEALQADPRFQPLMTLTNNAGITPEDIPLMTREAALSLMTNPTANLPSEEEHILTRIAQRQHAEVPQPYTTFTGNEPDCPICLQDIDASSPVVELVHPWTPGTYAPRRPGPQEKPHLFHTACLRRNTRHNVNSDGVTFDPEARTYFYKWAREYGDAA